MENLLHRIRVSTQHMLGLATESGHRVPEILRARRRPSNRLLLVVFCLLFTANSFAIVTNINSGVTHDKIEDAVDAADSGDTLLVSTGLYSYITLGIADKNLAIIGGYNSDFSVQVSSYDTVFEAQGYCVSFSHSTSFVEKVTFTGGITGMESYDSSIVTARYCTVENNISYFPGAGIYVHANGILVLEASAVKNNSATNTGNNGNGGGAYISSGGKLILSGRSYIRNNSATVNGGGIYVNGASASVELKDRSYISANTAGEDGGGIYLNGGTLSVYDGADIGYQSLNPNTAGEDGGGIYAENALITFTGSGTFLYNNYAGDKGGGAFLSDSILFVIDDAGIGYEGFACSNSAANSGGGIYADEGSTVAITNAMIENCLAKFGGGIYSSDSTIFIKNSKIGNTNELYTNVSIQDGGGLYIIGGTCMVQHSTFINNRAGDDGGAIALAFCDLTITNTVLEKNKAIKGGGGVYAIVDSIVNISVSSIVSNEAEFGGGIYWGSNTNMTIRNSIINRNIAGEDGGGVYVSGSGLVLFNDVEIPRNEADGNGGGIYANDDQRVKFIDSYVYNNMAQKGGGIYAEGGADVEITADKKDVVINGNSADYGGGMYVIDANSKVDIVSTSGYEVMMDYNLVSTSGGGIYARKFSEITILGNIRIYRCTADYGGGIVVAEAAKVTLNKSGNYYPVIEKCSADVSGGAAYVISPDSLFDCNGVLFGGADSGNKAKGDADGNGGGAVAVLSEAEFRAFDCVFEENLTANDGGAIAVFTATAVIGSDTDDGAGKPIPTFNFLKNMATNNGYGGAVYLNHGNAEFYNVSIVSNRSQRGGGIYASYSDADFANVLIAKNYASLFGGGDGIGTFNATVAMNNCTVAYNYDDGLAVGNSSSVAITNCIIWGHNDFQITTNPVQTVVYSDIEDGYSGVGNINSFPLFWDTSKLKYQILEGSPCINVGTNLSWMTPATVDLDGNERIHDGTVDMGAYEFIPEPFYLSFIIYQLLFINRKFLFNFSSRN